MAKRIAFQFDDKLPFQRAAINSVINLFKGVSRHDEGTIYRQISHIRGIGEGDPVRNPQIVRESRLLQNLRAVQLGNMLFMDQELKNNNFTVEMETGTGKTYVYLRTILELHEAYGFTKFMIVVPSIAIRKGVEKSIEMLREHFKILYDGLDLKKHAFVYDSKNLSRVGGSFVETRDLSIMIMNIQAFNKDTNLIRQATEQGRILWEDIKYINPVVIIDEPQKIEGSGGKKSASLQALEMIRPLFILRYSATHKKLFNQTYKLDSYDAYQSDLVKRIEVKTVHGTIPKDFPYIRYVEFTRDLYAKIEIFHVEQGGMIRRVRFKVRGGDSLYECSGNLEQYRNMFIQEDPHKLKKLKIGKWDGLLELAPGESNVDISAEETVRIQIRLAIKSHLQKQYNILKKGYMIKVMSLFFIDAVQKFRDNSAADGRGEYLRIFDEEYNRITNDTQWNKVFREYPALFKHYQDVQKVREGYFAVDKNKKAVEVESWVSNKDRLKKKSQEDVDRGIELILEKKDELISFEEPLAFIFSHSALREGWDNPNVFTLCTLKRSSSEIAKKQEIGRGLRLPVDINGKRCVDNEVNVLTVIANDYYDSFAAALQEDFNESAGFNKDEVTFDVIFSTLKEAGLPGAKILETAELFRNELLQNGIINKGGLLTKDALQIQNICFSNEVLQEHSIKIKEKFIEVMLKKGTRKIPIKNGDEDPVENRAHSYISEEYFAKLLKELGQRMSKRTMYQVNVESAAFIDACGAVLNQKLRYKQVKHEYEIETGLAGFDDQKKFIMHDPLPQKTIVEAKEAGAPKNDFKIINYIMYHTLLPRLAIFKIISGLEKKELLNNQDILDQVTQDIKEMLTDYMAKGDLKYDIIDGYEFEQSTVFAIDQIDRAMLDEAADLILKTNAGKRKAVHRYYKFDVPGEKKFAERLEEDPAVVLYTKLKKGGFVIDTPYGEYSPDWAVIRQEDGEGKTRLFFIVETKINKKERDLSDVEKTKIKCGKLHFRAVADDIDFKWAKNYDHFLKKIGVF